MRRRRSASVGTGKLLTCQARDFQADVLSNFTLGKSEFSVAYLPVIGQESRALSQCGHSGRSVLLLPNFPSMTRLQNPIHKLNRYPPFGLLPPAHDQDIHAFKLRSRE